LKHKAIVKKYNGRGKHFTKSIGWEQRELGRKNVITKYTVKNTVKDLEDEEEVFELGHGVTVRKYNFEKDKGD